MPPRKRRRACITPRPRGAAAVTSPEWRLPPDILLEITARTDTATFIRFAATCKALRREILHPDFVRRVCSGGGVVVPSAPMLFSLDKTLSLVHPTTPAAVSLAQDHLAPFVSLSAAALLEEYGPVTSRGGLVLLERRQVINDMRRTDDMCVYDPMTNSRAFLPFPRQHEFRFRRDHLYSYVLLTPADGGGIVVGSSSSFMVVAVDIVCCPGARCPLRVQTVSSGDGGEWGPVSYATNPIPSPSSMPVEEDNAAVVVDGVLPVDRLPANWSVLASCLSLSPDGKLCLVTVRGLRVSIWLLSEVDDDGWTLHAEVDMEPTLSLLFSSNKWARHCVRLQSSGDQRSGVVLLRVHSPGNVEELVVLDMETMETSRIGEISGLPFEVNLVSRLSAMQTAFKIKAGLGLRKGKG
ncbi:hypothetical protein BS78_01G071300 [Paspalum vaginatum]|nr:hypothetical protein BS78_01G071300 [Paspalum vaginatum]